MTNEDIKIIEDRLEKDIVYFENIGFPILASKFKEDLSTIRYLKNKENNR